VDLRKVEVASISRAKRFWRPAIVNTRTPLPVISYHEFFEEPVIRQLDGHQVQVKVSVIE
jgi:hypothetical protein